ncbi:hypothetical protein LPB260_24285 [Pseudomonas sp. LPB0260]|uniref:hypothetical protein n=1 Tax=Pseudomonas sp. LPB0260 TaxID=2614442 RepID=UPI0015C286FD|nr:hypothetical protein [Pseudomonas sp. LPB0260]QLC73831.1 hypothetical protein LPB260_09335 [Pseudomonas sp. LPB0260]QLC76605.1 hypothetical protein LPB260_24285 [Pseudomonas sp. LPB0260]
MSRVSVLVFCVLLLCGCVTTNVSKNYSLKENSGTGLVVGSITYDGSYSGYAVSYRRAPSEASGRFQSGQSNVVIPYFPAGEFETMGINGNLIAAELPAGDYVIDAWSVGSGAAFVRPTRPFSILFSVIPGKATYIGNFHFTQLSRMGLTVTGAKVDFSDKRERDSDVLKKHYPNLSTVSIVSAVEPGLHVTELGGLHHTTISIDVPITY